MDFQLESYGSEVKLEEKWRHLESGKGLIICKSESRRRKVVVVVVA